MLSLTQIIITKLGNQVTKYGNCKFLEISLFYSKSLIVSYLHMNINIKLTMNFSSVEILNLISQSSENRWSNVGNKHETYHFTYSIYDLPDSYSLCPKYQSIS